jgi:ribonuclease HI
LPNSIAPEPADKLLLFTDAATSPQACVAVGAFLCLTPLELDEYAEFTHTGLSAKLAGSIAYNTYASKKSTWSEIQTVIDALYHIQKNFPPGKHIEIYTDCQTLCDLMQGRKEKLEKNNFITRTGKVLQNADLYKELFAITEKFKIRIFKIKGHAATMNRLTIHEKIFSILDKLSRKKLRSLLINEKPV